MKRVTHFIFAIILTATPILSFGQDTTITSENSKKEKKISYSLINEYGFFIGKTKYFPFFLPGVTGIFVNGIRFDETQNEIGIGVGTEFVMDSPWRFFPVYLNYRHYYQGKGNKKPLINIGVGTLLTLQRDPYLNEVPPCTAGLYTTIAGGFKAKAFSFTSGIFLKSSDGDFVGGVEIKAGFTF